MEKTMRSVVVICCVLTIVSAHSSYQWLSRSERAIDPRACFDRFTVLSKNLDYLEETVYPLAFPQASTERECAEKCLNSMAFLNVRCHSYRYEELWSAKSTCILRSNYVSGDKVQFISKTITVFYGNRTVSCHVQ